jgi:cytidylate kinase
MGEDSDAATSSVMENRPGNAILWLHGPAGSGKSAVEQSFCQKLEDEGRLGGSFFSGVAIRLAGMHRSYSPLSHTSWLSCFPDCDNSSYRRSRMTLPSSRGRFETSFKN